MKKSKFLTLSFTLITFLFAEISFVPTSYSLPEPPQGVQTVGPLADLAFIDYQNNSFALFHSEDLYQIPFILGRVEERQGKRQLVPTRGIETFGDFYVLLDPENPDSLEVVEKLPEGGFGRLLRFRGKTGGRWVDLEFIYEDRAHSLTILDHQSGRFFRITFTEKKEAPFSLFPKNEEKGLRDLRASGGSTFKLIPLRKSVFGGNLPEWGRFHSQFDALFGQEIWQSHHVRGPPAGGVWQ